MTNGRERLADDARLECRICWYVYDPELGDPVEQIPPGTPFLELPSHWRCPPTRYASNANRKRAVFLHGDPPCPKAA